MAPFRYSAAVLGVELVWLGERALVKPLLFLLLLLLMPLMVMVLLVILGVELVLAVAWSELQTTTMMTVELPLLLPLTIAVVLCGKLEVAAVAVHERVADMRLPQTSMAI